MFRACAIVTVLPITVAAVRNALNHWEPTWDAAVVAVRARDVFSAHPPLIGYVALPSSKGGSLFSFPGALETYLLAGPVHLLGTTWGLLLGMAAVNSAALLSAIWLIRRRVGTTQAIGACVVISSVLWALGSEILIDPTPSQAGVLTFFAFLVAAWSVAADDHPSLVVLAATGSYLFLNQLQYALIVPVVGVVALAAWVLPRLRARRSTPDGHARDEG